MPAPGVNSKMIMKFVHHVWHGIAAVGAVAFVACVASPQPSSGRATMTDYRQQVTELLKSIETGDSKPLAYINPDTYIQQHLAVGDGLAGRRALFISLRKESASV